MRCDPVVVFGFSGDNNVLLVEMRICRSTLSVSVNGFSIHVTESTPMPLLAAVLEVVRDAQ